MGYAEGHDLFAAEAWSDRLLVLVEDISGFVSLEPAQSCSAAPTARILIRWGAIFGPPKVWISDTATHSEGGLMTMLAEACGVHRRFAVAHSAWTNGTPEGYKKEANRKTKAFVLVNSDARRTRGGRWIQRWIGRLRLRSWSAVPGDDE